MGAQPCLNQESAAQGAWPASQPSHPSPLTPQSTRPATPGIAPSAQWPSRGTTSAWTTGPSPATSPSGTGQAPLRTKTTGTAGTSVAPGAFRTTQPPTPLKSHIGESLGWGLGGAGPWQGCPHLLGPCLGPLNAPRAPRDPFSRTGATSWRTTRSSATWTCTSPCRPGRTTSCTLTTR